MRQVAHPLHGAGVGPVAAAGVDEDVAAVDVAVDVGVGVDVCVGVAIVGHDATAATAGACVDRQRV